MYCWTYARQWHEFQQKDGVSDGVNGPVFISIGTPEKLETFLELNPYMPRDSILVDDYEHRLYKKLGFSRFDEVSMDQANGISLKKLLRFFNLGVGSLWNYTTRFLDMAPVEGGVDWTDLPEGGLRNGGTIVVKGDDVVYQWSDTIPSDVPDIADVIVAARNA